MIFIKKNKGEYMKIYKKIIFLMISLIVSGSIVFAQEHFNPVDKTGDYCAVVITEATIDDAVLEIGDEIGVFDGSLCVAAEVYQGEFPVSCPASMEYISPNGDTLIGAKNGNPMFFKMWDKSRSLEIDAEATFEQGGNFGDVLTVVEPLEAESGASEVNDNDNSWPSDYHLFQNYPNPFNPETSISYQLSEAGMVNIGIYDICGKRIRTLVNSFKPAGKYSVTWDGYDNKKIRVSTGVYFIRMNSKDFSASRKLLLVQ